MKKRFYSEFTPRFSDFDLQGIMNSRCYLDLLAEGVSHARAAIENPSTRAMLAADHADLDLVRLAAAVMPPVTQAREWEQSGTGNDALVGENLVNAADQLLSGPQMP